MFLLHIFSLKEVLLRFKSKQINIEKLKIKNHQMRTNVYLNKCIFCSEQMYSEQMYIFKRLTVTYPFLKCFPSMVGGREGTEGQGLQSQMRGSAR